MNNRAQNISNILEGLHIEEDAAAIARRNKIGKNHSYSSSKVKSTSSQSDFSLAKKDYDVTYDEKTRKGDEWSTTTKSKVIKAHSSKNAEEMARKELEKARTPERVLVFRSVHLKG